jgi:hypothetical protein
VSEVNRFGSRAGSGTTGQAPANLGFEATEESLTILPDYTPTVRPPPSAWPSWLDICLIPACPARTATVVRVVSDLH